MNDLETARGIAVTLEQELARLDRLARNLARDLAEMHAAEAIDIDKWPNAWLLVKWSEEDLWSR